MGEVEVEVGPMMWRLSLMAWRAWCWAALWLHYELTPWTPAKSTVIAAAVSASGSPAVSSVLQFA